MDEGVVLRRKFIAQEELNVEISEPKSTDDMENNSEDMDSKETRLTLMEEILLLGLKDREGYTSFWNDSISSGLRGCILIELALRNRIALESAGMRKRSALSRRVVCIKSAPTGDVLLDEALRHIKENDGENVKTWIEYLSGETWNPLKLKLQLRNVRERLAKNLVEKGVCTTEKQNFVLFDMTTHPLVDSVMKQKLIKRIQDIAIQRWNSDVQKMNKRVLSLVMLAYFSDVLENAFGPLSDDEYELSMKRVREVLDKDFDAESLKDGSCDVMWAVFESFRN